MWYENEKSCKTNTKTQESQEIEESMTLKNLQTYATHEPATFSNPILSFPTKWKEERGVLSAKPKKREIRKPAGLIDSRKEKFDFATKMAACDFKLASIRKSFDDNVKCIMSASLTPAAIYQVMEFRCVPIKYCRFDCRSFF